MLTELPQRVSVLHDGGLKARHDANEAAGATSTVLVTLTRGQRIRLRMAETRATACALPSWEVSGDNETERSL